MGNPTIGLYTYTVLLVIERMCDEMKQCEKIVNNVDWVLGGMVVIDDNIEDGVKLFTGYAPEFGYGGISVATIKTDIELFTL